MILKASQRGHARELARHLTNTDDNEHVEIHAMEGFIGDTVYDALAEIEAIARGTKCTQPLFSVSLNPPLDQTPSVETFENAIDRIEEKTGLQNQPRLILFHEKEGRRHAHAVWSRIDSENMKAVNLPFYKNRMMEISKELYLENEWDLPKGFIDQEMRNPLNFSLAQWQQAKRLGHDPTLIKQTLSQCWAHSDDPKSFSTSLEEYGFYLAKGDRRGFVAVDWRGEVYSLSRWLSVKTKELKARLGEPAQFKSVEDVKAGLDQKMAAQLDQFEDKLKEKHQRQIAPFVKQKERLVQRHQDERKELAEEQAQRQAQDMRNRLARFNAGLRALWDRMTGKHAQIKKQNEAEAWQAHLRDRKQREELIEKQLSERQKLQVRMNALRDEYKAEYFNLRQYLSNTANATEKNTQEMQRSPREADRQAQDLNNHIQMDIEREPD